MRKPAISPLIVATARCFVPFAALGYLAYALRQTTDHLTNGAGRAFGDDFLCFWSGAYLALHHRAGEIYNFARFHAFAQSVVGAPTKFVDYCYPPVLLLLCLPLAFLPYASALFVWLTAGWYAFYRVLRLAVPGRGAWLLALATPAAFVNALTGQNGFLTTALLGGGLGLLERRPILAGSLFGILTFKPQIGILVPVALMAGREWRAITSAAITAGLLFAVTSLLFGPQLWIEFAHNLSVFRDLVLEHGNGVWHRLVSVFVAARRFGVPIGISYAVQALAALAACTIVVLVWVGDAPRGIKNAVLLIATCFATPYLMDYDLVFSGLIVAWLWQQPAARYRSERSLQIASGLLLLLPLFAAPIGKLAGICLGPFALMPILVVAVDAAFRDQSFQAALRIGAAEFEHID